MNSRRDRRSSRLIRNHRKRLAKKLLREFSAQMLQLLQSSSVVIPDASQVEVMRIGGKS